MISCDCNTTRKLIRSISILARAPGADSREIQEGVVIDVDDKGKIVGIDIQHASEILDLATLEADSLPVTSLRSSGTR